MRIKIDPVLGPNRFDKSSKMIFADFNGLLNGAWMDVLTVLGHFSASPFVAFAAVKEC